MKRIGLTGGFGSGKSTVTDILQQEGLPVLDADEIARQVLESDESLVTSIKKQFGSELIDDKGCLDRKKLAAIVFNDMQALKKLNGIMHPAILLCIEETLLELADAGQTIAFVDVPLLFEVEWDQDMDGTLVVWAPQDVCVARLKQKGIDQSDIAQRMAVQLSLDTKRDRATWWIDNSGTVHETVDKTLKILSEIKQELRLAP